MTTTSLNLLRHPARMPWLAQAVHSGFVVCLLAGVAGGAAWAHWAHRQHEALLTERARLQTQAQTLAGQQAQARALQERRNLQQAVLARTQDWQGQRRSALQWHGVLAAQAGTGLRVEHWQFDGRQLLLQAWLPGPQGLPPLMAALSAAGPQAWTLQSLAQAGSGVGFVLEAKVPDSAPAAGKAGP